MSARELRIGFVGAGENTRNRHIPGLAAIPGVKLHGVVNRSAESTARVAGHFQIPQQYSRWQDLVADPRIDAVVIGTWPDLHAEVTCAALAAGKHVLCEARMARNLEEAREMHAASVAHPQLTAMLVPSPYGLVVGPEVKLLLESKFIGDLRELVVLGAEDQFHDYSKPLHWRQDAAISGQNVLSLGILHETALRWTPAPKRVFAQTHIFESQRAHPHEQGYIPVTVPDSVQVLTVLENNARGIYHQSGIALFGTGKQIHLYGAQGTMKIVFGKEEELWIGRPGFSEMKRVEIPADHLGHWNVEADFIAAIRGEAAVTLTDFATGLRYMEFTAAVARSAASNQPVELR